MADTDAGEAGEPSDVDLLIDEFHDFLPRHMAMEGLLVALLKRATMQAEDPVALVDWLRNETLGRLTSSEAGPLTEAIRGHLEMTLGGLEQLPRRR